MKIFLPIVSFLVVSFAASVHSRSIHRFRRSLYYANETACVVDDVPYYNGDPVPSSDPCEECKCRTPGFVCTITECEEKEGCERVKTPGECCSYQCGKDGEVGEPLPQEDPKELPVIPVSTTLIPVSLSTDLEEKKPEEPLPIKNEDPKELPLSENPKLDAVGSKPAEVSTTKQPDVPQDVDSKKDLTQEDKPELRQEPEIKDKELSKEPEPSAELQKETSQSAHDTLHTTKEPELSLSTRQEPSDSDKKLEAVTETKKEGRSSTEEQKSEVTSPASLEDSSKTSEESKETVEVKPEEELKFVVKEEPSTEKSEEITSSSPSSESKQESSSESVEVKKDPTTVATPEKKSSDEKLPLPPQKEDKVGESTTLPPLSDTSEAASKSEESSLVEVSSTTLADQPEGREGAVDIEEEVKPIKVDSPSKEDLAAKVTESDTTSAPSKSEVVPELKKEERKDETEAVPVPLSTEQPKEEEKETSPPPQKNGPSKRFADWIDYVPRDYQV